MAYEGAFRCAVLTPTKELFAGSIHYAEIPGYAGHYGVIKGHESLVATNHQGGKLVLWLDPEGKEKKEFLVHRGCTQMLHDHLAVLCRFGREINDIDVERCERRIKEVEADLEQMRAEFEAEADEDRKAAIQAQITTEEIHLSWFEAQIEFVETGHESYKQ